MWSSNYYYNLSQFFIYSLIMYLGMHVYRYPITTRSTLASHCLNCISLNTNKNIHIEIVKYYLIDLKCI